MRMTRRHGERGFTLAELVVVVALIALLTVGIGRLFAGVSDAVGRGLAASELDATARAIEGNLRRDFARVNRMASEDTFLVIRAAEIGGDPDRPIYLTADDREADVRDGVTPYAEGSRAIFTRLDEMAFLARASGAEAFRTQQESGIFTSGQPSAEGARIYYGHGLRPRQDPDWPPPEGATDAPDAPLRQFVSDGWFGSRPAASDGRGYLPSGPISGRNEYAADWVLARQALLLYGPEATGVADPDNADSTFGTDREYAPYVRDLETLHRFWRELDYGGAGINGAEEFAYPGPVFPSTEPNAEDRRPDPRLIMHGRVDVCAQSLEDVKRWLEGEGPLWDAGTDSIEAAAYSNRSGTAFGVPSDQEIELDPRRDDRYGLSDDDLRDPGSQSVQKGLWKRAADAQTTEAIDENNLPSSFIDPGDPLEALAYNFSGIRSAIAGTLARPLVDPESTPGTRVSDTTLGTTADQLRYAAEHDAGMDTHAVLAPRCSRFAVSWSDGSYWVDDVDFDGDGEPDARAGDLVWFGPERLDETDRNDDDARRATYEELWGEYGLDSTDPLIRWATLYTDAGESPDGEGSPLIQTIAGDFDGEIGTDAGFPVSLVPELGFGPPDDFDEDTFQSVSQPLLNLLTGGEIEPEDPALPYYNPDLTGGVPSDEGWPDASPGSPSQDMNQYLAAWPFRTPTSAGAWGPAYEKNLWVRVEFTLHDPLGRVDSGRDYEVVLHMHPREER